MRRRVVVGTMLALLGGSLAVFTTVDAGAFAQYTDVPRTHPLIHQIDWMDHRGIITGYPDGTFRPSQPVSRQAVAAFLHRHAGEPSATPPVPTFSDVTSTNPHYRAIRWLASQGFVAGFADGTFRPQAIVTRQELAAILHRYGHGHPELAPGEGSSFTDVAKSHLFHDEITWLAAGGVTSGFSDGTYRPLTKVTRLQMVSLLFQFDSRFSMTGTVEMVSQPQGGEPWISISHEPDLSSDGRYVAFTSSADDLTPGDEPDTFDVFVRDLGTGALDLVSVGIDGNPVGGASGPSISGDGRYVAFASPAGSLTEHVTNHVGDVFLRDRLARTTTLVSVSTGGGPANGKSEAPTVSDDGSKVAFHSLASDLGPDDDPGARDTFVWDRASGATTLASVGMAPASRTHGFGHDRPAISADGRFAAFCSRTSLVGADSDDDIDVYRRDLQLDVTELVSTSTTATRVDYCEPSLTADGEQVAFSSYGDGVLKRNMQSGALERIDKTTDGFVRHGQAPVISADGRFVAFLTDWDFAPYEEDSEPDVYIRDTERGVLSWASRSVPGSEAAVVGRPAISADGTRVAFASNDEGIDEVYLFSAHD
jgi:Tol biopolymer transport system component